MCNMHKCRSIQTHTQTCPHIHQLIYVYVCRFIATFSGRNFWVLPQIAICWQTKFSAELTELLATCLRCYPGVIPAYLQSANISPRAKFPTCCRHPYQWQITNWATQLDADLTARSIIIKQQTSCPPPSVPPPAPFSPNTNIYQYQPEQESNNNSNISNYLAEQTTRRGQVCGVCVIEVVIPCVGPEQTNVCVQLIRHQSVNRLCG